MLHVTMGHRDKAGFQTECLVSFSLSILLLCLFSPPQGWLFARHGWTKLYSVEQRARSQYQG